MKAKTLFIAGIMAVALFVLAGCNNDEMGPVDVDFNISLDVDNVPDRQHIVGVGQKANILTYVVYMKGSDDVVLEGTQEFPGLKTTLKLRLPADNMYDVILLAHANNDSVPFHFDAPSRSLVMDYVQEGDVYTLHGTNENMDAFYWHHTQYFEHGTKLSAVLRRAFAQINVGAAIEDYQVVSQKWYTPTSVVVEVDQLYSTLNLFTDVYDGRVGKVRYNKSLISVLENEQFPKVEMHPDDTYKYLSMNYALAGDVAICDDANVMVSLYFYDENDVLRRQIENIPAVPVRRNFRTNIYGRSIFTVEGSVDIEKDIDWNNRFLNVESNDMAIY